MSFRSCWRISYKKRLTHTFIINVTLLTLRHSDMFQPSKGQLQGVRQIHFDSKVNKIFTRFKIQLSEHYVVVLHELFNIDTFYALPKHHGASHHLCPGNDEVFSISPYHYHASMNFSLNA